MSKAFNKKTLLITLALAFLVKTQQQQIKCSPETLDELCQAQDKFVVCAVDDDDQFLTFKSACQACGYEDTISYSKGPCKCPKIPCDEGQSCLDRKCIDVTKMNTSQLIDAAYNFITQQNNEQALVLLQKVLALTEQDPYVYYLSSLASFGLQKNKDSLKYIKKAISLDPSSPGYYIIRGRAFAEQKQFQQAEKQYKKVLDMGFQDVGLISFYQAQGLLQNQKNEEAIRKFQEALKYHPQKIQWYVRKAMAHAINKQYKMALLTCRMGLKVEPGNQQITLFMKQFLSIDEGQQKDIEKIQQSSQMAAEASATPDPQFVNKIMRERQQDDEMQFSRRRMQQKRLKKQIQQKKKAKKSDTQKQEKQL